ncbi:MAG: Tetracycline resistance protein, class C [Chlamydiae bacterium]|nr:Tetracycline resistance protein, class C [Chlamydiota bacterium]
MGILKKSHTLSLSVLLMVTFIDFMGMGLIYPIFSKLFFDTSIPFFSSETSSEIRGIWLGVLFALMPFIQFFSLPIWGAISDKKGRKKPLLQSLSFSSLGHFISIFGIIFNSIWILVISRIILGIGAGNISIVQASIANISTNEQKAKNFGLYAMAIGAGFTFGPFIGGGLSIYSFSFPFSFSCILTLINIVLAALFFKEPLHTLYEKAVSFSVGLKNLKKAFTTKAIRTFFLCSFLVSFAWTYFMDFSPVYLIKTFQFSSAQVGLFYGAIGGFYALSAGLLIRPLLSRYKTQLLFWASSFLGGLCILSIPYYPSYYWLIPFVIIYSYIIAFLNPTITTIISNNASSDMQGEALGLLGSVNTAAYAISALIAGVFVGMNPVFSMYIGGSVMLIASFIVLGVFKKKLFS